MDVIEFNSSVLLVLLFIKEFGRWWLYDLVSNYKLEVDLWRCFVVFLL